jgi:hypothetical protein
MNKLNENGLIAVIISNDFGTQWFTNHGVSALIFDPNVVKLIQNKSLNAIQRGIQIENYCDKVYGARDYWGDSTNLKVSWVGPGGKFGIVYEDGWEYIVPGPEFEVFIA